MVLQQILCGWDTHLSGQGKVSGTNSAREAAMPRCRHRTAGIVTRIPGLQVLCRACASRMPKNCIFTEFGLYHSMQDIYIKKMVYQCMPYTNHMHHFSAKPGTESTERDKDTERRGLCSCHPQWLHLLHLGSYRFFVGCHGLSCPPKAQSFLDQ